MSGDDAMRADGLGVRLTYDDFLLFPDDGKRHELIDGEHYVTPSPDMKHQRISGNLYFLVRTYLEGHPLGRIFYAPFDVVFSQFDVVEPDLLYMSSERAAQILTALHVEGAPELVIEIASPSTRRRDETVKRRLYEKSGVSEYWLVDPDVDVVRVYRRDVRLIPDTIARDVRPKPDTTAAGARFERPIELAREAGDVLLTPLLPGLELRLADVFRE